MNTLQKIGKVTKNMRVARGLSQEQFCNQCGIDQHYISNIENGQRNVSVDVVERIADFFGLSLSQFFAAVETYIETSISNGSFIESEPPTTSIVSEPKPRSSSRQTKVKIDETSYTRWMKLQRLSDRTIKSYSSNTANCIEVQSIIQGVAGTLNMYEVTSLHHLNRIIDIIKNSEFDQTGHSMYSAGVKKWRDYLKATNQIS